MRHPYSRLFLRRLALVAATTLPLSACGAATAHNRGVDIAAALTPSPRGERAITEVNRQYLQDGQLSVVVMGRGHAWLDTGTHESLIEASVFVQTIEKRQGLKIACPEEVAYRMKFIDASMLKELALPLAKSGYGKYLIQLLAE